MRWLVGLAALLLLGSAAAQIPDIPTIPPAEPPDPSQVPDPPSLPPLQQPSPPGIPDPGLPVFRTANESGEPGAPLEEYQHAIWQDGQHVGAVASGYDLIDLRAWEVDDYDFGGGLVMRLEVAGAAALEQEQYVIEGRLLIEESNATPIILIWTDDGETWQSDQHILMQNKTGPDGPGAALPGATAQHVIHVFMDYESLNASIGQTVAQWSFTAYADSGTAVRMTDIAPGGYFLAPQAELPEPNAAGTIDDESRSGTATEPPGLFLRGAGQHIGISGQWADGIATMIVSNPYNRTPQEIAMAYPAEASPLDGTSGWIEANSSMQFRFAVPQQSSAYTVQWDVRSSIGGVAQVSLSLPALPPPPPPAPEPEPEPRPDPVPLVRTDPVVEPPSEPEPVSPPPSGEPEGEESPGIGILLVVAVAIAVWIRKR